MNKTHLYQNIYKIFPALLIIFTFYTVAIPENTFALVPKTSVAADEKQDENFDKKFREGRDLLDKQEWKKAAEKFSEVINQYPDNKSTDAALYWLAFCYKKQREFEKMGATVDRLMKGYPMSSWTSDAQVLLVEVAAPVNGLKATVAGDKSGAVYSVFAPAQITGKLLTSSADYPAFNQIAIGEAKTPLDREDELKLAAFQSLLAADQQKGIEAISNILKKDSKASESLKLTALRAIRRPDNFRANSLNGVYFVSNVRVSNQMNPLLKDLLIKNYQDNPNAQIRREIVLTIGSLRDEASINILAELYKKETEPQVKWAIIDGIGSNWSDANGFFALNGTSVLAASPTVTTVGVGQNVSGTAKVVANQTGAANAAKITETQKLRFSTLMEILRTEKTSELRRVALNNLQRFSGWRDDSRMMETLLQTYDSETDEGVKYFIIQSFVKIKQPQSIKKLIEIARNEKSDYLKIAAVRALGESKDPEAIKYLEEIIK